MYRVLGKGSANDWESLMETPVVYHKASILPASSRYSMNKVFWCQHLFQNWKNEFPEPMQSSIQTLRNWETKSIINQKTTNQDLYDSSLSTVPTDQEH